MVSSPRSLHGTSCVSVIRRVYVCPTLNIKPSCASKKQKLRSGAIRFFARKHFFHLYRNFSVEIFRMGNCEEEKLQSQAEPFLSDELGCICNHKIASNAEGEEEKAG